MSTTTSKASGRSPRGSTITTVTVLAAVTGSLIANPRIRAAARASWQRAERRHHLNTLYARGLFTTAAPIPGFSEPGRIVWTGAR